MIGITLTSEQIRTAPVEVRQWIEREVVSSLGLQAPPAKAIGQESQFASCGPEELAAVLSQIQSFLPAVNVFFDLGRQGPLLGQSGIEVLRLTDIAHHTQLQNPAQVVACLNLINDAFTRIRGNSSAIFCGVDREGHCFVAMGTQQNIQRMWRDLVGQPAAANGLNGLSPSVAVENMDNGRASLQTPAPANDAIADRQQAAT